MRDVGIERYHTFRVVNSPRAPALCPGAGLLADVRVAGAGEEGKKPADKDMKEPGLCRVVSLILPVFSGQRVACSW